MKIGDRVYHKVSGKVGTIISLYVPFNQQQYGLLYAKVQRDKHNFISDKLSNFIPEQDYKPEPFNPVGVNNLPEKDIKDLYSAPNMDDLHPALTKETENQRPASESKIASGSKVSSGSKKKAQTKESLMDDICSGIVTDSGSSESDS